MPHDCRFCTCTSCSPWEPLVRNFRHRGRDVACECTRCPYERPAYPDSPSKGPGLPVTGPPEPLVGKAAPPGERLAPRTFVLVGNVEVAPSVHYLTFELPNGEPFDFLPGQYVTFTLRRDGRSAPRSYSIASSNHEHRRFSLLVKKVPDGFGSQYLCGLDPAGRPSVSGLGPLGRFVLHDPDGRAVVLVATGVGLAPFLPMLEHLREAFPRTPVWLFHGVRFADELPNRAELAALETRWSGFHFVPVISRPPQDGSWSGETGHVEDQVRSRFPDLNDADVYLCGANRMVSEMQRLALGLHCPKEHVFVDRWGDHPE